VLRTGPETAELASEVQGESADAWVPPTPARVKGNEGFPAQAAGKLNRVVPR